MWTNPRRPEFVDQAFESDPQGACVGHYDGYLLSSVFQPIVKIDDSRHAVIGYEALVRVQRDSTQISPLDFFKLVHPDDRFFIDWLCRAIHLRNFATRRTDTARIFINLDPGSLVERERSLREIPIMISRMAEIGLAPEDVIFEITETEATNIDTLTELVATLQQNGFAVAIDDYGVSSSTMERVNTLNPDIVKLDHTWCRKMAADAATLDALQQTISFFSANDIAVLFEGVETDSDVAFVRANKIQLMQGFLLGRPSPTLVSGEPVIYPPAVS